MKTYFSHVVNKRARVCVYIGTHFSHRRNLCQAKMCRHKSLYFMRPVRMQKLIRGRETSARIWNIIIIIILFCSSVCVCVCARCQTDGHVMIQIRYYRRRQEKTAEMFRNYKKKNKQKARQLLRFRKFLFCSSIFGRWRGQIVIYYNQDSRAIEINHRI